MKGQASAEGDQDPEAEKDEEEEDEEPPVYDIFDSIILYTILYTIYHILYTIPWPPSARTATCRSRCRPFVTIVVMRIITYRS